jgi:hypothetical protein
MQDHKTTLLVNGCSYGACWNPSTDFVAGLGLEQVVNVSRVGTSFQRACRVTVEWIAQNGNPGMVFLPLTFPHRWELALGIDEDPLDGSWLPLQNSYYIEDNHRLYDPIVEIKKFVNLYYKTIPNIKTYWDLMFTNIIMISGFLESRNIPYLIWDMCNGFEKKHLERDTKGRERYKAFEKIKLIEENKRIIDIWNFCGNKFMWDTMPADLQKTTADYGHHHNETQYKELENYILTYLKRIDP